MKLKLTPQHWGGIGCILLSIFVAERFPPRSFLLPANEAIESEGPKTENDISWSLLETLDYKAGTAPTPLQSHIGHPVRIPGFAVPLSASTQTIDELILVPNQLACIHVPPPPPNLMIHIKLPRPIDVEKIYGPLWVSGRLELKAVHSAFGLVSWEMSDVVIKPYDDY